MDEKILKDAQYRKGLSIAFFNATNSAIAMLTADKINMSSTQMEEYITKWRNWFLDTHKEYYATVIANVGVNYQASETIEKFRACTTKVELANLWRGISEDERRDGEIRKVVKELRETLK